MVPDRDSAGTVSIMLGGSVRLDLLEPNKKARAEGAHFDVF